MDSNMVLTPDVFPPLVVDTADAVEWNDSADTVVVGFGAAGASVALEAREKASADDVLVIDRFEGGGASAYSGGVYYAGGTRHQAEAGYQDNAEEMYQYLKQEVGDAVSDETLRRFCDTSNDSLTWLEKHGVPFSSALHEGKTTYPPEGKYLYYSGNEKVPSYAARAKPAPRGHRTIGKFFSGNVFFAALRKAVETANIRLMFHAPVRRLVVDAAGHVLGVEVTTISEAERAEHQALYGRVAPLRPFQNMRAEKAIAACQILENGASDRRLIRARKGVVLATGGFIYNVPMLKQYVRASCADNYLALVRTGSMGCSGAGIRLGMSVGGAVGKMENMLIGRTIAPPTPPLEGIIVNSDGRRMINEDVYIGFLGEAISQQPEGKAWLILDSGTFWRMMREALPNGDGAFLLFKLPVLANVLFGGTKRAPTVAALAAKCGIDPAGLGDEISTYNDAIRQGAGDPLGKGAAYLHTLDSGPYYAINMCLGNRYALTSVLTLGGLRIDEATGAVVKQDGQTIGGLYAVGRAAVGVCSNAYFSGMALADCVFSGRRTGAHLAKAGVAK